MPLHYDLSIANTVQFLSNNYTEANCNIPRITTALCHHSINKKLIANYITIMTMRCLNHYNAHNIRANTLLYWCQGNHPSIATCIENVMTTMNKEECNNYVLHALHWLWHFIHTVSSHSFITQQCILMKPGDLSRKLG